MSLIKRQPIKILSIFLLFAIIAFLAVGASGFKGIIPGSMLFSNKYDNGYYVFHRLLTELDYSVEFEKEYSVPNAASSTIVYATADKENFSTEEHLSWLKEGNTLVLIGNSSTLLLDEDAIQSGESLVLRDFYNRTPAHGALYASEYFNKESMDNLNRYKVHYKTPDGAVIAESFIGSGRVLFICDLSLFNNENMHNLQNALLLNELFSDMKGHPIYLRERSPEAIYDASLITGLLEGKGMFIFLQFLILFILAVLIMGKRFARPEKLTARKRRKVTEHVKAVGLFFQKANAYELVETIDTEYFKTIICKSKKPSVLSLDEYTEYGSVKEDITEDDTVQRFKERQLLKSRLDNRR
jgi:Domain of unknown function (DUF4350)